MALRNQPYLPLYVQDFLTDEKLRECSAEAIGVYIMIMCVLHKQENYGKILLKQKYKQSDKQIENFAYCFAKHLPFSLSIICKALSELIDENVLSLDGDFLIQKRMVKDNEISEIRAIAGKNGVKNKAHFAKAKHKANMLAKGLANTENEYIYNNSIDNNTSIVNKEEDLNYLRRKKEENADFVFCMEKIYQKSWEEYKSILNGQAKFLTEEIFINWKKFVELSNEKFPSILSTKFVSPKDFGILMNQKGFLKEKWEETLEAICATGVRPEHDLFFRIPQFMEIVNEKKNKKIKSNKNEKIGTSAARAAKLENW